MKIKEKQKMLKKIGLYTDKIDGIYGKNSKNAEKQFITIFGSLNLLEKVYKSYKKSKYMQKNDWELFKNFKKSEFYCTCHKKYCNGYNGRENKIPMHLLMACQYIRNTHKKPLKFSCTIRCDKRNKEVGGVSKSKHRLFQAFDGTISGVKSSEFVKTAYKLPFTHYSYSITSSYAHVDINI